MSVEEISQTINQFIYEATEMNLVKPVDEIYLRNRLLSYLELNEFKETTISTNKVNILDTLDKIVEYAIEHSIIDDFNYSKDIFEAKIMNLVTPLPSDVNERFWKKYNQNKKSATDYFYKLSRDNNYIKTRSIAKNIFFETTSPYGNLEITINLSKPEKDPKEIAALTKVVSSNYPKCVLCLENEGHQGNSSQPARENHRIVRMNVNNETYGMQYSPFVYYNEHSIFINEEHKPMIIDQKCIHNLLSIVETLPHYFVGSNADLPIVGGSILNHDHYQGGRYKFPIEDAESIQTIALKKHSNVSASIVRWPLSVLRLKSTNKNDMVDAVCHIINIWEDYNDEEHHIISHTNGTRHNTITPIARYKDGQYEMDVVLRNNRTNEEFPDGIFHPHSDIHHIKKENIGLIEVMGLAILPPRLLDELNEIENYLLEKSDLNEVAEIHKDWAASLKNEHPKLTEDTVSAFLKQEVGNKFTRALEDAGVYKQDNRGLNGFNKFVDALNENN